MIEPRKGLTWRRASRCSNGTCVEVARDGEQILVRDSKNPHIAPLRFSSAEWTSFLAGAREGDFDF